MKITCCIDHLGPGGSQRQLCLLARSLKELKHELTVVTYHCNDHFKQELLQNEIEHIQLRADSYWERFWSLRRVTRDKNADLVIAFLRTPSLLAELATVPAHPFKLIVSERNFYPNEFFLWRKFRLLCHLFADGLVTNSQRLKKKLESEWPGLGKKVHHIPNGIDLSLFQPAKEEKVGKTKIVVLAKYHWQKAPQLLVEALALLEADHPEIDYEVNWYGADYQSYVFHETKALVHRYGMAKNVHLLGPTAEVPQVLQGAHLFVLPSRYEGMANVVGEALASGCPVIMNSQANEGELVVDGENGFLFDGAEPSELKGALVRYFAASLEERQEMGQRGREKAALELSLENFVRAYVELIEKL